MGMGSHQAGDTAEGPEGRSRADSNRCEGVERREAVDHSLVLRRLARSSAALRRHWWHGGGHETPPSVRH